MKFYFEKDLKRFFTDKVKEFLNNGYCIEELWHPFSCMLIRGDFEAHITLRSEILLERKHQYFHYFDTEALLEIIEKKSGIVFNKSCFKLGYEFINKTKRIYICDDEDFQKIIEKKIQRDSNRLGEFITLPKKYNEIVFKIFSKKRMYKGLIRRGVVLVERKRFTNEYHIRVNGYAGSTELYKFKLTDKKEEIKWTMKN